MGARSVPGQRHPARTASTRWRSGSRSTSCGPTRRRRRRRSVAQQLRLRAEPRLRRLPQHRDEGRSEPQPTRRGCSSATPTTSAPRRGTRTGSPTVRRRTASCRSSALNHTGVADWVRTMGPTLVFNVRGGLNQYLELARSDPGLGFNPAELGFPPSLVNQLPNQVFPRINFCDATRPARLTGLSGHSGAPDRNSETTTGFSLQPNFSWTQGQAQRARRPRHAPHLVHARDQRQPVRPDFDRRFTQRVVQSERRAERQRDRVVPARRAERRRGSTTTSTRRSAGTTTRRGCRTTGGSPIA